MWKLIFLVLIVWLIVSIAKRMLTNTHNRSTKQAPADSRQQDTAENHNTTENMVQCCICQIHLPRSEAFMVQGKFYCSHAHIQRKQHE